MWITSLTLDKLGLIYVLVYSVFYRWSVCLFQNKNSRKLQTVTVIKVNKLNIKVIQVKFVIKHGNE